MCGADSIGLTALDPYLGSSPRVRSGPVQGEARGRLGGIISACAERTSALHASHMARRDHLRVCGADHVPKKPLQEGRGSSPRVRSGLSACGETAGDAVDHLRVCGADLIAELHPAIHKGSSPRERSGRRPQAARRTGVGIISASAERASRPPVFRAAPPDHFRVCGADEVPNQRKVPTNGIISACAERTNPK